MSLNRKLRNALLHKSGFTIIEIMVVVVIIGILAGVGVPKLFGQIEKTREKTDLAWLYHIAHAVDHQLALNGGNMEAMKSDSAAGSDRYYNWETVSDWLKDKSGMILFRVERRSQPKQPSESTYWFGRGTAAKTAAYSEGFFYDVMNELGWADIYRHLSASDKYYTYSGPFFTSRALTRKPSEGGAGSKDLYHVRVRWQSSNPNRSQVEESKSVIVWLGTGDWNDPIKSEHGVCFSTEPKACQ